MAPAAQIPFSNPAGNNQTSPASGMPKPVGSSAMPVASPQTVKQNSFIPSSAHTTGSVPATGVPNAGGLTNNGTNTAGDTGAVNKQLIDIYGKGVGGALASLLSGMSGSDSKVLQDYIASLQPQMAKAQANTNAALGAGGVSANSSVAAIADSNLQAQETAAIAGESAKLTQNQEQLTAEILTGMEASSQKEVASSNWDVFSEVLQTGATIAGDLIHG